MKQQLYNTFFKILKNKWFTKTLTNISYLILTVFYLLVRKFCDRKGNRKAVDIKLAEQAKNRLFDVYRPKNMESDNINGEVDCEMDLSIVIPAYNVEQYIEECIQSVLQQQTKYNYEVIIVNDGSSDGTREIIQKIISDKINYIEQENRGLAGARNTGINASKGQYITFVDSDDVLADGCIDKMMDAIVGENADVVIGAYYHFSELVEKKQYFDRVDEVIIDDRKKIVYNPGYAWGKIFRRELFNNVRFPEGAWFEDTLICTVIYRMCKKMVSISDYVYGYRQNYAGITRVARKSKKSLDHIWVMENAIEQAKKNKLENDEILYGLVLNHMSNLLYRRISFLGEDVKKNAFYVACAILKKIKPTNYKIDGRVIEKDIEKSFETGNYKLWKLASFIV